MKRSVPTLFLFLLALSHPSIAGLRWENLEQRISADPEEKVATAKFAFVNEGSVPVEILAVHTNCGCTGAKPAKNPVGPGEKSEIAVTFKFGDRKGAYSTPVTVKTNDAANAETKLTLIVDIIPPVEISPKLLFWKKNEALDAKDITVRRVGKDRIENLRAAAGTPELKVNVQEIKRGDEYRIAVDPGAVQKSLRNEIPVTIQFASGKVKETNLHVKVR